MACRVEMEIARELLHPTRRAPGGRRAANVRGRALEQARRPMSASVQILPQGKRGGARWTPRGQALLSTRPGNVPGRRHMHRHQWKLRRHLLVVEWGDP